MSFLRLLFAVVVAVSLAIFTPAARSASHELVSRFFYGPNGPTGPVVLGPDGYYWGTSTQGGHVAGAVGFYGYQQAAYGTVYKVRPDGSDLQVIRSFKHDDPDGESPAGGLTYDGAGSVWGTTSTTVGGTIFKIKVSDGSFKTLASVGSPRGALLKVGATMWGISYYGATLTFGAVFKVSSAGKVTYVVEFTGNGATNKGSYPEGDLIYDGKLVWGTTSTGGANDLGTIFNIDASGKLTTVVEFSGNGALNKGSKPLGALTVVDANTLWGTTSKGGASDFGTIFKLDKTTKTLTTLVEFTGNGAKNKGKAPNAALLSDGAGAFWSTTLQGGADDVGTIFKIALTFNPATDAISPQAEFTAAPPSLTGMNPKGLVDDGAGNFLGTAQGGGDNRGRFYKISKAGGALIALADFQDLALAPGGGLTADSAGNLWGVAGFATAQFVDGVVFKYDRHTGLRTSVATFPQPVEFHSSLSTAKLFFDGAHTMWGTTNRGGTNQTGSIFKVDTATGTLTTVMSFSTNSGATNGFRPLAGLVSDGQGLLWGTTQNGGSDDDGMVFTVNPSNNAFTPLLSFTDTGASNHGKNPVRALVDDGVDSMWGTNDGGINSGGTIFKIHKTTHVLTSVMEFSKVT
ncbi:MAG TPA: choice-of-anchor tandem repeat GloVer-containing protein, partial [Chthoniobacteraceae bacterium]|nr:choice-of-anchor tandem repeat GloVer-containing protein [Chthoniobacteraceae bacterium]